MLMPDEVVLVLLEHCATEAGFGRTALQKVSYLAAERLDWSNLGHAAYYYGPYSRTLDHQTRRLVAEGLVEETSDDLGFVGSSGFRGKRYQYALTAQGFGAVEALERVAPDDVESLRSVADRIRDVIGGYDQRVLSLAAKTHYIVKQRQGETVECDEIGEFALELGWKLSPRMVESVAEKLERLGLAQVIRD